MRYSMLYQYALDWCADRRFLAKEKDGGGGLAKPNQDCILTAFGVMLSTAVPPPTIACNTVLSIATVGRCVRKLF